MDRTVQSMWALLCICINSCYPAYFHRIMVVRPCVAAFSTLCRHGRTHTNAARNKFAYACWPNPQARVWKNVRVCVEVGEM